MRLSRRGERKALRDDRLQLLLPKEIEQGDHVLSEQGRLHVVKDKLRALLVELVREDLAARLPAGTRRDAVAAFLAGALFELLIWSLEARPPTTAEEADALFHELAAPALAAGTAR